MIENNEQKNLGYYCKLFSKIKVNKTKQRGEAPYKPILLLSIIDLIAQDTIQENNIYISDELINTFNRYWDILSPDSFLRQSIVRNAFFRKAVVHLYDYKCSICHLKVIHSLTQSVVDGAHIKPLYKFYDNQISNGICLCKNHHWAFDQGLLSIGDDYRIIISKQFQEESPYAKPLEEFHGAIILLPNDRKNYPRLEAI